MVKMIYGGSGHNLIYSGDEIEYIYGEGGNDHIYAGVGDIVDGGANEDEIYGVIDATMLGGTGDDLLILDLTSVTTGTTLIASQQATSDYEIYTNTFISGFEQFFLKLGSGDNLLDLRGAQLTEYSSITGGSGSNTVVVDVNSRGILYLAKSWRLEADLSTLTTNVSMSDNLVSFNGFEISVPYQSSPGWTILSGSGNDHLSGSLGRDILRGGSGNDWVEGGVGDTLSGDEGLDTLWLDLQSVTTSISLRITDLGPSDYTIAPNTVISGFETYGIAFGSGDDILHLGGAQLTYATPSLQNYFSARAGTDQVIVDKDSRGHAVVTGFENFVADLSTMTTAITSDGSRLSFDGFSIEFEDAAPAFSIRGGSGNDSFTGAGGADVLSGGAGNDTLSGQGGSDIYAFSIGWGKDRIVNADASDSTDAIRFDASVAAADIGLSRAGNDLVLSHVNGQDEITIENYYSDASPEIEEFRFTNGTIWRAPVVTLSAGGTSATVAENKTAATVVIADAQGAATFAIVGGADSAKFVINAATGALSFKSAPNFENPTDAGTDNVYDVVVRAIDARGLVKTQALTLQVTNANEAPAINSNGGGSSASVSIAENRTAVLAATAMDPEKAGITWSISGGADKSLFQINAQTGALSFKSAADFDLAKDSGRNNVYDVTIKATDAGGLSDTQAVAVKVTNINEAPVIQTNGGGNAASIK